MDFAVFASVFGIVIAALLALVHGMALRELARIAATLESIRDRVETLEIAVAGLRRREESRGGGAPSS